METKPYPAILFYAQNSSTTFSIKLIKSHRTNEKRVAPAKNAGGHNGSIDRDTTTFLGAKALIPVKTTSSTVAVLKD